MNSAGRKTPHSKAIEPEGALDLWRESTGGRSLIDPSAVWLFLRRNAWRMGVVALGTSAALFIAGFFLLHKYSATAVMMVDPRIARVTQSGGVLTNIGGDAIAVESLVQAARSEGFLGELVDQLDLTHDSYFAGGGDAPPLVRLATIEKLGAKLVIARRGTTYVIDVTATSPSAEKSAKIANAAAKKIIEDQAQLRTGASADTAKEIESRLDDLRARVNRAEQAAAELKVRLKVTDAGQGNTLLERRLSELNQQSVLAGARTAEARARYELLRRANMTHGDNLPQTVQSTVLASLRTEYARLSRQSADQATILGPRHPEVASLNAQLADVRRQIAAEIGRMMTAAHNEYLEAEQREAALSSQLRAAQNESGQLGPELVKLGELEREAKAERGVYEQLLSRQRELTQVKDLDPSDIRIVSPALPPSKPTPSRMIIAGGSAALGLLTGLLYALQRELRRSTLKTATQATRLGGVETTVFAPLIKDLETPNTSTPDLTPWLGDLCAEIKEQGGEAGLVLLVSSTHRGEGRSALAANLATFLGEGGDQVLLIEADRPHEGKRVRYGLLDVLDSGEDLRGAFISGPSYTFLPFGGRAAHHASIGALLSGVTWRATLQLARRWFDVIIIDGPPALEAPHARLLAADADDTIFVVEWDKTSSADANAAIDRLDIERAAVLYNKVDASRLGLYDPTHSRLMSMQTEDLAEAA